MSRRMLSSLKRNKLLQNSGLLLLAQSTLLGFAVVGSSAVSAQTEFTCESAPYQETLERRLRALDVSVARDLEEPREFLSPTPPEDNPDAVLPDPNPQAAIDSMNDEIRIDRLASHEKAEVYNLYAFAYYMLEDNARALQYYNRILAEDGANGSLIVRTLKTIAQLNMLEENYRPALDTYINWACLRQIQGSPIGAEEYSQIATIYYRLEDLRTALFYIEKSISMTEAEGGIGKENWYSMQRSILYQQNDIPGVLRVLKKLVVYYPNVKYWREMGGMFSEMEDTRNQLAAYHLAYLQDGLETESQYKGLGYLYIASGAPFEGAEIMVEGIELGIIEETEEVYRTIGSAYYQAREMDQALPWMEKAAAASEDGEAYGRLANIYLSLARLEDAVRAGREAVDRGGLSRRDQVLLTIGSALHGLKRYDDALQQFGFIRDDRSTAAKNSWINFVQAEKERDAQLRASGIDLDSL